ncbi:hypothetical protein ACTHAM_002359 [Cellulomonas soli]|uniref:hypothetical protein n=1 Tax=Cellulomonas soli TaxID=931535 RepID=UPI003F847FBA
MSEPTPGAPFVTVQAVADHMRMTLSADEGELAKLTEHTASALEWAVSEVGPLGEVSQTIDVQQSGRYLVLPMTHLAEVTSVIDPSGAEVAVTAAQVDRLAGIITVPHLRAGDWRVAVRTDQQRASVSLAVKIVAAHLWETQRGKGDPQRRQMMAGQDDQLAPTRVGFAVPRRAAQLIAPFRIP